MINIKNLDFKYKESKDNNLDNVSITIPDNSITGLIGKNGSGKTTLIKFLCGLLNNYSYSEINLDGYSSFNNKYKNEIGLVLSSDQLYDDLTGYENINFYLKLNKVKINKSEIDKLANSIGINNDLNKLVRTYSFGMKQKLNIIKVVLAKKKFLILDEPTIGLDITTKNEILELLKNIILKESDIKILITTHNLEDLPKICNNLIFINERKILYEGKIDDLFNSYSKIVYEYIIDNKYLDKLKDIIKLSKFLSCINTNELTTKCIIFSNNDPLIENKSLKYNKKIIRNIELADIFFIKTNSEYD